MGPVVKGQVGESAPARGAPCVSVEAGLACGAGVARAVGQPDRAVVRVVPARDALVVGSCSVHALAGSVAPGAIAQEHVVGLSTRQQRRGLLSRNRRPGAVDAQASGAEVLAGGVHDPVRGGALAQAQSIGPGHEALTVFTVQWAHRVVSLTSCGVAWNALTAVHGLPRQPDSTVVQALPGERAFQTGFQILQAAVAQAGRVVDRDDDIGRWLAGETRRVLREQKRLGQHGGAHGGAGEQDETDMNGAMHGGTFAVH